MNWKLKATIQNIASRLPPNVSYSTYYLIQRHFGGLRRINPVRRMNAGIEIWKRIKKQNVNPIGKIFFEVGTGRVPLVPMAYWLMGAEKTISIDLNPYMKKELITESLKYIDENNEAILDIFGSLIFKERFNDLLNFSRKHQTTISDFIDLCRVDYIAPGDAADTSLSDQSVDFHTSNLVFEHIPNEVLKRILEEGNRIIAKDGLFIHRIDYSDHFSHSDKSISAINFLQYSDEEWKGYAENRYMYMNRMRHDDFIHLFESVGHRIVETQPSIDRRSQELLRTGKVKLNKFFLDKDQNVLAITGAWFTTIIDGQSGATVCCNGVQKCCRR